MFDLARSKFLGDELGRYQLLVQIGQGGMAAVFLGRLRGVAGFAKLVVIKRMHAHLSYDKRFIELFANEGRVVAQLSHPNICQVHELGDEDGSLFLVMEYLQGVPWEELVRVLPRDSRELPLLIGVLAQACEGLHYAHQLRDHSGQATPVIHRDVSPQNLFITTDGICKVLDFGVAKMSTSDRYSQSGLIKGKLPYMAPEQIRGEPVDSRTDVFAMGVVLWEALTGKRLFVRSSDYLVWKAVTEEPITPVSELRPDLPRRIEQIVRCALQRDPEHRYPSIQMLAQEMRMAIKPPALEPRAIASAVKTLCADQLAEVARVVSKALTAIDSPGEDREDRSDTEQGGRAETLFVDEPKSVMLREESFHKLAAPTWRWRYPVVGAAALALGVGLAAIGREPPQPSTPMITAASAPVAMPADSVTEPKSDGSAPLSAVPENQRQRTDVPRVVPQDASLQAEPELQDLVELEPDSSHNARAKSRTPGRLGRELTSQDKPSAPAPKRSAAELPLETSTAEDPGSERGSVGHYTVDSRPYAIISIDGVRLGETPLFRVPLAPGVHKVRAVRSDGVTKTFSITIVADKEVSSGQLQW